MSDTADSASQDSPAPPEKRPRPGWHLPVLLAALVVLGLGSGLWSARRTAYQDRVARLRGVVERCVAAGNALASDWPELPPRDRWAVLAALLADDTLTWQTTLADEPVVVMLLWTVRQDPDWSRRAHAARALGQMALYTPSPGEEGAPDPTVVEETARALMEGADRDHHAAVRLAARAALLRFRGVARAHGLDQPDDAPMVESLPMP